jgi:probable HAF family extracellular repeat protein
MKEKMFIFLCIPFFIGCSGGYVISTLPDLDGAVGRAMDINNQGVIVGYCETEAGDFHAVLWDGSGVTDLGTLGGDDSYALGINDDGVIVGHSKTADGKAHAFIWQDGIMADIHDPELPPLTKVTQEQSIIMEWLQEPLVMVVSYGIRLVSTSGC